MPRLLFPLLSLFLCLPLRATEMPAYLKTALAGFRPDMPRGWAYTVATTRGNEKAIERFDPSAPAGHQWRLLQRNGRTPSAEETNEYLSYKITNADAAKTTFGRGDLDLDTLCLQREDSLEAVFNCRFRKDINDQLLSHLQLTFTVAKQSAAVERCRLSLTAPYSPVLTTKTLELDLETTFAGQGTGRPSLPLRVKSHYRGLVFWVKSVEEDLQSEYSDFVWVGTRFAGSKASGAPE